MACGLHNASRCSAPWRCWLSPRSQPELRHQRNRLLARSSRGTSICSTNWQVGDDWWYTIERNVRFTGTYSGQADFTELVIIEPDGTTHLYGSMAFSGKACGDQDGADVPDRRSWQPGNDDRGHLHGSGGEQRKARGRNVHGHARHRRPVHRRGELRLN